MDAHTPKFAISLLPAFRSMGIGSALMRAMLALLREQGFSRAALAVQKDNYAVHMYTSLGFTVTGSTAEEYIMVCAL